MKNRAKSIALILGLVVVVTASAPPAPKFDQPALITSAGQSAEVQLAAVLAKRAGLEYTLTKLAQPADLEGIATLMLSIGASLKGLGAAGLDIAQEKARVKDLLQEAERVDIPLLLLHLGGEARRGQLTDELITELIPQAGLVIVVASGNRDELFTTICREHDVALIQVERASDALEPLRAAFQSSR